MRHVTTLHDIPIRINKGVEQILLVPQHNWKLNGRPMLAPMTKKLLPGDDSLNRTLEVLALEGFDGEAPTAFRRTVLPAVRLTLHSPSKDQLTDYEILPVASHYHRGKHEVRAEKLGGRWMTRAQALRDPALSPTARSVLAVVRCDPTGPLSPQAFAGSSTDRLVFARDIDRRAYWPLFLEMRGWVECHLWKHFDHPREVEDVLSETGLSGYAHLDSFDGRSAKAWLGTIARNHEIAVLRDRARRRQVSLNLGDAPLPVADRTPGPAETLGEAEGVALVRAREEAVKRAMTPVARLAWRLWREEGMPYKDISYTLDVPEGTLGTWFYRARQAILSARGTACGW